MSESRSGILRDWGATSEDIREAMNLAVHNALREHKLAGRPVVFWDRERDAIVEVPPEAIVIPEVPTAGDQPGKPDLSSN